LTTLSTLFTFFFTMIPQQPRSTLFPYTTLFRSSCVGKSTKEIKKRSEIPEELTWKLEDIFATDEQWEEEFKQLQTDIPKIGEFQGKLGESAEQLFDLFTLQDQLSERLGKLFTYAHMRSDQDTTNSFYQEMNTKAENVLTLASSSMSFIVAEIMEIDEEKLNSFLEENEGLQLYRKTLDEITRQRPHVLSHQEEVLLAEVADPLGNASNTFGMLNNADLTFPVIKNEQGEDVELTHGRYIGCLESKDRSVRAAAFNGTYETYGKFITTSVTNLIGDLKKNNM